VDMLDVYRFEPKICLF